MLTKSITAACFIAAALITPVRAQSFIADLPGYPVQLWRQPAKGVTVAMLIGYLEDGKPALRIYIKNSSDKDELLPRIGRNFAIQVFFIKEDGSKIPLQNYTPVIHSATNPGFYMPPMPDVIAYQPGQIALKTIELSRNQLTLANQYPVICRFMYSPITSTRDVPFVETDPIKVTEKRDGSFRPYP